MPRRSSQTERTQVDEGAAPSSHFGGTVIDLATRKVVRAVARQDRKDGLGMLAAFGIVAALGAATVWMVRSQPESSRTKDGQQVTLPFDLATPLPVIPVLPGPLGAMPGASEAEPDALAPPPLSPVLAEPPGMAVSSPTMPKLNPHSSPTVVYDGGVDGSADIMISDPSTPGEGAGNLAPVARSIREPGRTVTRGTMIPAVLETAIDANAPGYVRAVVSTDVRSYDGKRMLVPRSSRLLGQYRSEVSGGQKRAYVIWTRLTKPDGSVLDIAGGAGDGQFMRRFGAASLTSIIGSGGQAGLPDRVRQGEPIRVLTARDFELAK
jgi:type IV secretion system protein VirB10